MGTVFLPRCMFGVFLMDVDIMNFILLNNGYFYSPTNIFEFGSGTLLNYLEAV